MKWTDIHERAGVIVEFLLRSVRNHREEVDRDCEDAGLLDRMANSEYWQQRLQERERFDYQKAYQALRAHIQRKRFRRYRLLAAAVAFLFLSVGIGLMWESGQHENSGKVEVGKTYTGSPMKKGIVLTLNDGSKVELGREKQVLNESKVAITIDSGKMRYEVVDTLIHEEPVYNILDIPKGGEYKILLSDGTKVWLNAASRLKFPVVFKGHERKVYLSGEAYFDVSGDPGNPFIVSTEKGAIAVYGTQFNVKQYPEEKNIEVTLVTGSVSFAVPQGETVNLQPDNRLVYDGMGKFPEITPVNVKNYVSWKDNVFCFEDEPLENIMRVLSRWYDVDIVFRTAGLKELKFTGNLNKYNDIHSFLRLFEVSVPVSFDLQGKCVVVKEKIDGQ